MRLFYNFAFLLWVIFFFAHPVLAQQPVEISPTIAGQIEGYIYFKGTVKDEVIGGARIKIRHLESDNTTEVQLTDDLLSYSNGWFYFMGLSPGKYRAYIDPMQLELLHYVSSPAYIDFEIKEEGDAAEGLNFTLKASTSIPSSQAAPEDELLKIPVTVSRAVGVYSGINSLPESVRRTKAFARGLHELRHHAGFDGIYDREARIAAFEQTQSDILRDAMQSDKVSGSKLPVFSSAWTNIGPANTGGMTKALAIDPTNSNIMYAGA
ncbi:MAG: carboxypeptidase-like regulatory domain-containing protein, partial [Candidatus Kapaibacterium sp.]